MKPIFIVLLLLFTSCTYSFTQTSYTFIPTEPIRLIFRLESIKIENKPHHYAVLIAGNSEDRHRNNLSLAYQVLLEQGYKYDDVFIFDSEGGDPPQFPLTDQTSLKSMDIIFSWLAQNVTTNDTLLVYMTGHGTRLLGQSSFILNRVEYLMKNDFLNKIEKINPQVGVIITDFCYWGLMKNDSIPDYILITATDDYHVSYGTTFGRTFWRTIRKIDNQSILEIFSQTQKVDSILSKQLNRPDISYINNNPIDFNIMGLKF